MAIAGRRARGRGPGGGAAAVGGGALLAAGGLLRLIGTLIRVLALIVAAIIAIAVVLRVLDAASTNAVVQAFHDAGKALVGPFDGMFKIHDAKLAMAVNWGIAALVYVFVGSLIARLLHRLAPA